MAPILRRWDGGLPGLPGRVQVVDQRPKAFGEHDLPQLLDRYVWRDTHAAMILVIGNRDASAVIDKADTAIRSHDRFQGDGTDIEGTPVVVLHKESDPDREKLALVTAAIHG